MRTLKDELLIWAAMIAGAVIEGLVIAAFIIGVAEGDFQRIWTLCVSFVCLGIAPQVWALEQVGFFADNQE